MNLCLYNEPLKAFLSSNLRATPTTAYLQHNYVLCISHISKYNDIKYNDIKYNDIKYNDIKYNDIKYNDI